MSMSCALRKPGFYPAVMKPSVATCHPWLQDSQLPSSFTWRWHRLCCRFARSLTLRHRRLQLFTFFVRTVSADFLLISTLSAHLLSLPSSSESEKQLKDSLFMEQFPDLLEYNNSPKGCSLIVGDFKFQNDVPTNTYTPGLSTFLSPSTSVTQSPLPLTDLVTFSTGSSTGRTMTPSCLQPPVLLSSLITTLS